MSNVTALDAIYNRKDRILNVINPIVTNKELWFLTVMETIAKDHNLASAPPAKIIACVYQAMRDGLTIDNKEATIVAYKGNLTYMPMVRGIIKKMYIEGEAQRVTADAIYAGDVFEYSITTESGEVIRHLPNILGDRGEIVGAYAFAKLKTGEVISCVMGKAEILKHRDVSPSWLYAKDRNASIWVKWEKPMFVKTVLHGLAKRMPSARLDLTDIEPQGEHNKEVADIFGDAATIDVTPHEAEEAQSPQKTQFEQFIGEQYETTV